MGLIDKIKTATSVEVMDKLLEQGSKFSMASPKTQRRWKYAVVRRVLELQTEKQVLQNEKIEPPEKIVKKKK